MYFSHWIRTATHSHAVRRGLLLLGAIMLTGVAGASDQDGLSEASYLEDVPVVLSAARLAQPLTEAPAAVTVINREMIDASGARQIADLFRLVPGFTVAYQNGYTPSVTYHGLADEFSRRMQVLIDGRSVYVPSIGGVTWSDLPISIDDIDHIEVIRGPASASYGANSFLAVISITTRQASVDKTTALHLAYGEHRIRDGSVRLGGGSRNLDYHLTAGYQQDDGFDNRYDGQRTRLINARAEYQLGVSDNLEGQIGLSEGRRDNGFAGEVFDPPHGKQTGSHFERLRWLHSTGDTKEFSLQFYHNYHNSDEDYSSLPIDLSDIDLGTVQLPLSFDILAERYDLELQVTQTLPHNLRAVWGGSVRQDQVTAPTYFATTDALTIDLYRLFGNLEWHLQPALIANVGAMIENNDITGSNISPRLALNYHLDDRQTLRATISSATRTPTLFEDQANYKLTVGPINDLLFLSKGILESERITSRDIGYLFNWPERGTALDIRIYHDSLSKLIRSDYVCNKSDIACLEKVLDSNLDNVCLEPGTNRCYNYQIQKNIDAATIRGLEMHLDQRLGAATRVIVGYAYTKITDNDSRDRLERSTPKNNIHLLLIQKLPADTQASLAYYQTGRMEYLGSGNGTALQRRLDLRLAHRIKHASDRLTIAVVAQNLLNDYPDFLNQEDARNLFDTRVFIEMDWDMP